MRISINYFQLFCLIIFLAACGSTNTSDNTTETSEDSMENDSETSTMEEEKMCFFAMGASVNVEINLIFEGDNIKGKALYVQPKAGMTMYQSYNISGERSNEQLNVTMTLADSDSGQMIGSSSETTWKLEGDKLILTEDVIEELKKKECEENASFEEEVQELLIEENSYDYKGTIDGSLKVVMHLDTKTNPENKQELIVSGYYYYESSGEDNKIQLEGMHSYVGMIATRIAEVKDGETFGTFVFEPGFQFGEELNGTWYSADDSKELEVVLTP